jgi:hypothetical protein
MIIYSLNATSVACIIEKSYFRGSATQQADSKNPVPNANRRGTCFSSQECSNNGGTASGSCAAGLVLIRIM